MTRIDEDRTLEQYGYRQELRRSLTFTDLLVYGLIFMVPIAPFGIFGSVFQASGGMVALAYAIGMLAMIFTANSYAQMAKAFPMAGSVYTYAGRGIAAPVGFLSGWMILLDYILVPSLLYLIASLAMNSLVSSVPVWLWLLLFVVLNTVVNYPGIEMTARITKLMLVAELIVLAIFLVIGAVAVAQGKGNGFSFDAFYNSDTFSYSLLFGAVSVAVLSFLGFDGISTLAEESRQQPRRASGDFAVAVRHGPRPAVAQLLGEDSREPPRAGQRHTARGGCVTRRRPLHELPRRRHQFAGYVGELRSHDSVSRAARLSGGPLRHPAGQPRLAAPSGRPGDRVRDLGVCRHQRRRCRPELGFLVAWHWGGGARRVDRDRSHSRLGGGSTAESRRA